MQTITFSQLLLLLLTHKVDPWPINKDVHPLPPACSFSKLPHSYGFWGCTRPTGGVCGLKRHIVCDSSYVLKKTPPTTPTMAPSASKPGTTPPTLPEPIGYDVQANIKEHHLEVEEVKFSGKVIRRRKYSLSSNLVLSLLCSTRYWLPPCQALPSRAMEIVRKNLLQGMTRTDS